MLIGLHGVGFSVRGDASNPAGGYVTRIGARRPWTGMILHSHVLLFCRGLWLGVRRCYQHCRAPLLSNVELDYCSFPKIDASLRLAQRITNSLNVPESLRINRYS